MASHIVYEPHCSKCGALINEEVSFKKIIMKSNDFRLFDFETGEVYPHVCKVCGTVFECIEINQPEILPTEEI